MAAAALIAREVKLLLDEMHSPSIAVALTEASFDVIAVAAHPELRGMPDEDLLIHATGAKRALVTENVADYMTLANRWAGESRTHSGLIFTNPNRFNRANLAYPGNLIKALRQFLEDPPIAGASWIWWL